VNARLDDIVGFDVSRETLDRLGLYEAMVRDEAERQNLVSRGTLDDFWERHIADSAQLVRYERAGGASWVDIGSGAGLPGIVIACLVEGPVSLVEPRRLRADFLHKVVGALGLSAQVLGINASRATGSFDVITARAVAPLTEMLKLSLHLSTRITTWVLPKGRNAETEVAQVQRSWQGKFHVERSVTDAESGIVIVTDVKAKRE
jgi:16S rRNA (guanine527-N7)-methyltransferase